MRLVGKGGSRRLILRFGCDINLRYKAEIIGCLEMVKSEFIGVCRRAEMVGHYRRMEIVCG